MCITVLLADDKEIVRRAIRGLLNESPEIELVGEAANFAQTIQMTQELKPQVIVMDLHMPDQRLGESMSARDLGSSLLLAMSLANDDEARFLAESFGAVKLLDKAQLYDELIPAIIQLSAPNTSSAAAGK
jgi:DNA-binding NarL/FixJ family response regulator